MAPGNYVLIFENVFDKSDVNDFTVRIYSGQKTAINAWNATQVSNFNKKLIQMALRSPDYAPYAQLYTNEIYFTEQVGYGPSFTYFQVDAQPYNVSINMTFYTN